MYDGRCEEAMQIFADVVHALEQTDDRTRLSDMYLGSRFMRDQAQYYAEDLAGGLANMLETYALAVRASNRTVQAGTSAYIALIHLARGEYDEALRWVERSVPVAESLGNVPAMRTTAAVGLVARRALGDTEVDGAWVDLIEQGFTARGDMALKGQLVVEALIAIGEVYRARNFIEVAYAHAGGRLREAICTAAFGRVMQHLGPSYWEDAARWYERARVLGAALGARSVQAAAGLGVAELAAARGEHAAAAAQIEEVRRICQAAGLRRYEQQATRLQAEIGAGVAEHA
jgi:tetratricopeptide (TPR) repeat protein